MFVPIFVFSLILNSFGIILTDNNNNNQNVTVAKIGDRERPWTA